MASVRVVAALLSGVSLGACSLPVPDYKVDLSIRRRTARIPDGAVLDNEDMKLDAQGYRVDKQGRRIGEVDVPAKTAGERSNAVAGYYISSRGATRRAPSWCRARAPAPAPATVRAAPRSRPGVEPMAPAATGQPAPLTPPR